MGNLSQLSLEGVEKATTEKIAAAAKEEDKIVERCELIEKKIETALGDGADVSVEVWNPWPWTEVLDMIACYYGATGGTSKDNLEVFVSVFNKIDIDGGGSIDQNEMYDALSNAGLDITEEGVLNLVAMIDEDGNGNIERGEWRETVEFYLELKEEEEERIRQEADPASVMKELRAKKLQELVKSAHALTKSVKIQEKMDTVKEGQTMEKIEQGQTMEKVEEGIHDEHDEESDVGLDLSAK